MRESDLAGANFADAVLRNVDLSGAQLRQSRFGKADLRGSDLSAFDPLTVDLKRAIIDPVQAVALAQALGLIVD